MALTFADRNEICDATNRSVTLLCFDTSLRHCVYSGKFGKTLFVSQFTSIYGTDLFANLWQRGFINTMAQVKEGEFCRLTIVTILCGYTKLKYRIGN